MSDNRLKLRFLALRFSLYDHLPFTIPRPHPNPSLGLVLYKALDLLCSWGVSG